MGILHGTLIFEKFMEKEGILSGKAERIPLFMKFYIDVRDLL